MVDDAPSPDPGATVRRLVRASDRAALSTALTDDQNETWPYGSLVLVACDHDGAPLLLLSDLAEHSGNIARNPRLSLLYDDTAGLDDPLTGARLTLLGRAEVSHEPRHRARYLARHPSAEGYAEFTDFKLYRVAVERGHLVAGFGRIDWLAREALLVDPSPSAALIEHEADILAHMNQDHTDAIDLFAQILLGREGSGWCLTGIDAQGCDLRLGGAVARLDFETPIANPGEARQILVTLTHRARAEAGQSG